MDLPDDVINDPLEALRVTTAIGGEAVHEIDDLLTAAETRAIEVAEPTAGAEASIRACRRSGRMVGVVSNNSAIAVSAYLDRHRLAQLVDGPVVGRAHAQPHLMKPDPHPIRLALDALGVPGEAVLFVGDSTTDVMAARMAGSNCIGYANHPDKWNRLAGADVVLDDMHVLADSLSRVPVVADA